MKRIIVIMVVILVLLSTATAFAGGSFAPPTEGTAKEGVFYVSLKISEQYPNLSSKYLAKYGDAYFFPAGKNKAKFELNLVEGDTIIHASLTKNKFTVIRNVRYKRFPLVKVVTDSDNNVVSATIFAAPGTRLFAPAPRNSLIKRIK